MNVKLMLLSAGAISALAFVAVPAVGFASEFPAVCSSGATCTGNVVGGPATLEDDGGFLAGKVSCIATSGTSSQTSNSSTGSATLTFTGCKDEALNTNCTSSGQAAGTIKTNSLVYHLVFIDSTAQGTLVGVQFTGVNVTFSCAGGLVQKTVTGSVIGQIENPECNVARASHAVNFIYGVPLGSQKYTQVTTTGTVFDLTSGSHSSDSTTSGVRGTGQLFYSEGKTVTLAC